VLLGSCLLAVTLCGCGGGSGGGTRYYEDFTMSWHAQTQTMSVARTAGPRDVQGTYVRLRSEYVTWNSEASTLSGLVWITNIYSGLLAQVEPQIISYDPSDQSITDNGPWNYGYIGEGATKGMTWTISDPNAVDFSFTVRVSFIIG
jgi:hypothetical protein